MDEPRSRAAQPGATSWPCAGRPRRTPSPTIPNRLVPIVTEPAHIGICVAGDPLRTNAYVFAHNGMLGMNCAKPVRLPADWEAKLAEAEAEADAEAQADAAARADASGP